MITTETCRTGNEYCFISFYSPDRETISYPVLFLSDIKGRIIKSDTLNQFPSSWLNYMLKRDDYTFYLIFKSGIIVIINSDLKILRSIRLHEELSGAGVLIDINEDHDCEIVLTELWSKKVFILSGDLKHQNAINLDRDDASFFNSCLINHKFFFNTNHFEYFISYRVAPFYYLQFPAYAGIYFIFAFVLLLVKKNQESRTREKYEFMGQVRSLEIRAFRSQMDPHFTFNLFNTISALLKKQKIEDALDAFSRFSKLIRLNLEHSEDLTRQLSEEMEAVESYLQISKLRFGDKIDYAITADMANLGSKIIPKMILLTHVENAVKHGILPKDGPGKIILQIARTGEELKVIIEDDGIGRKKAKEIQTSGNGLGLVLLQKLIDHLNKKNVNKISQKIVDMINHDGTAAGTVIEIIIPLDLKD
jgi:two-component sensor histidine kinase